MTLGQQLAAFAAGLRLEDIPSEVIGIAPVLLADTLACAIAAAAEPDAEAVDIVRDYAAMDRHRPEATVIGTDWQTSLRAASMANCTMARYLDANDIYMPATGSLSGSGHFSDALPALVAAAEAHRSSGPELMEAVVIAYETQAALADAFPWLDRGFHSVSQVTVAVALTAGRLMGLSEKQLAHAASLAITTGTFAQTWLQPSTTVPAIKGGAPGLAAERGLTCAELAGHAFTGPLDAFETFFGDFGAEPGQPERAFGCIGVNWKTTRNAVKPAPAQIFTQAVIQCAQELHREGLRLEDLETLSVRSNSGACGRVQGSPGAFRPVSREAADHSTPFVTAMALRDGGVTLETYHDRPWEAPDVLGAMSRMTLVIDDEWSARLDREGMLGAEIEAVDVHARRYQARVEQFRGHPDNPLTRDEQIGKLGAFVGRAGVLGSGAGAKLLQACEALARGGDVPAIVKLWRFTADQAADSSL